MRSVRIVTAACTALLGANAATAQAPTVPVGARIKLWQSDSLAVHHIGRVLDATADTIRVGAPDGTARAFALASVERIDMSRGIRAPLWTKVAGVWLVPATAVSATLLGMMSALVLDSGDDLDDGAAVGFVAGTAVGVAASVALWRTSRREQWSPLQLPGTRLVAAASAADSNPSYASWLVRVEPVPRQTRLRLRVTDGRSIDGTFIERRGDTLVLQAKNATRTEVPVSTVTEVRTSRGRDARAGAQVGALWGIGVGAALGLAVAATPNENNPMSDPDCPNDGATICPRDSDLTVAFMTTFMTTAVGAGIGAVIGKERWVPAMLAPRQASAPRLLITPRRDRVTIGLRATF